MAARGAQLVERLSLGCGACRADFSPVRRSASDPGRAAPHSAQAPRRSFSPSRRTAAATVAATGLSERPVLGQMADQIFVVRKVFQVVGFFPQELVHRQRPLFVPRRGPFEQERHLGQLFLGQLVDDLEERVEVGLGDLVADVAQLARTSAPEYPQPVSRLPTVSSSRASTATHKIGIHTETHQIDRLDEQVGDSPAWKCCQAGNVAFVRIGQVGCRVDRGPAGRRRRSFTLWGGCPVRFRRIDKVVGLLGAGRANWAQRGTRRRPCHRVRFHAMAQKLPPERPIGP